MTTETADSLLTGDGYLESLRDGREVWIDGERVDDVTAHPAFRNAARSVAALYDAMHDPELRDVLVSRDADGLTTHRFFRPSYTSDDLLASREAIVGLPLARLQDGESCFSIRAWSWASANFWVSVSIWICWFSTFASTE